MSTPELTPRPSLHDIAAMPFPASQAAMRKFYDPKWGTGSDSDGSLHSFKVTVEYSTKTYSEYTTTVEAETEEEAREIARDEAADEAGGEEFEVESISAFEIEEEPA